jgi:hypothetical protein
MSVSVGEQVSGSLLWVIAVANIGTACGYLYDRRWPLAFMYLAGAVAQAAMAWV